METTVLAHSSIYSSVQILVKIHNHQVEYCLVLNLNQDIEYLDCDYVVYVSRP